MSDEEIDEISLELIEAWRDVFGRKMYYVPLDRTNTKVHSLYGESEKKYYDFDNKVEFFGIFRQTKPYQERGEIYGRENYDFAEVTFVTKELYDLGVKTIDQSSVIEIFSKDGSRKLYNIIGDYGKVQLRDSILVTKLIVSEITETVRTNFQPNDEEVTEEIPETTEFKGLRYL